MSKTKKIFLVNTDPSQNEMLKAYINEHFKFEIVTFTNIEDAIRNLDLPPNVIILDYAMLDVSSALLFKKFKKSHFQTMTDWRQYLKPISKVSMK
jgi:DNA-binding NtrC family response regulator